LSSNNDNFVDLSFSFILVIEEAIEGLNFQCPVHTTTNHAELRYTLREGTNPQLKWKTNKNATALATGTLFQENTLYRIFLIFSIVLNLKLIC